MIDLNKKSLSISTINTNNLPAIPTTPKELAKFVKTQNNVLNIEKAFLFSQNLTIDNYNKVFKYTQQHAELLLDAELKLAHVFNNIKTNQGSNNGKTKTSIITGMGFTRRQYQDIQKLTPDSVEKAKELAREKGKLVTRNDAITLINKKHKEDNNAEFSRKNTGTYETVDMPTHNPARIANPIKYGVLFANVGIGEYYLEENGFHAAVASEYLPERADWYKQIYPTCNMIVGDINEKKDEFIKQFKESGCKMLLASPPCQTFTVAGKRDFTDKRTCLFLTTLEIIEKTKPEYVVIENVKEFLNARPIDLKHILGDKPIGDYIYEQLEALGYTVNVDVCNAADYGTPQSRERAIFLASLNGLWKFPKKDKFRIPLFKAIGDLPSIEAGQNSPFHPLHYALPLSQCQIDVLRHTPSGHSAHDNEKKWKPVTVEGKPSNAQHKTSFTRKDWNKPSSTITSDCVSISGHNTVHPGYPINIPGSNEILYSDARVLSILEVLRITGLPDDYPIPTWALGNDRFIREVIAECFAPRHVERLMTTLPYQLALPYIK